MPINNPFALESKSAYQRWRDWKLNAYPKRAEALVVEVKDPRALTEAEAREILRVCGKANMVIYVGRMVETAETQQSDEGKATLRKLGAQFGLHRLDSNMLADDDGMTSLRVMPEKSQRGYIPYSNKRLLWHTDGYYNPPERRIRALVLYCVMPAAQGGESALLDHEIVYIKIRDAEPAYIQALMTPDVLTIPANTGKGMETRPAQTGPVFSIDSVGGNLHMRYTARMRSIEWKSDPLTREAVRFLEDLLASDTPYIFRHRLEPGQGLLCNNVLHNRTGFEDDPDKGLSRLIYRARYYDRIAGTNMGELLGRDGYALSKRNTVAAPRH